MSLGGYQRLRAWGPESLWEFTTELDQDRKETGATTPPELGLGPLNEGAGCVGGGGSGTAFLRSHCGNMLQRI